MTSPAAEAYAATLSELDQSPNAVEPEAQLTRPVADFLEAYALEQGLGNLFLQREAQLVGVRPDFAALVDGRPCGWIELKAPGHSVDGSTWQGRERGQWARLAELDSLLVCNGETIRLYRLGEQLGEDVELPTRDASNWNPIALRGLVERFVTMRPPVISGVHQLAERLAPMAKLLRERIFAGLQEGTVRSSIVQAKESWAATVHEGVTDAVFASDLAQVVAYSLAIAGLSGVADSNGDGTVSLGEARQSLRTTNAVLAATLGPVLEIPGLDGELAPEIGAIERLVSALDPRAVAWSQDTRGEPWLWFYEDFLAQYDPEARERAGVYYTPTSVVQMQVRHVNSILRGVFSKRLGFADPTVVTLDPATGSGTYPLAVLDRAAAVAIEERGAAGPRQVVGHLVRNVMAFELLPGPYAVAHLRIGRRLAELDNSLVPPGNVRVYLTDTLDDPNTVPTQLPLWGDVQVLAEERERARTVKHDQPVTVILGNPPYQRGTRRDGGWVVNPAIGRSLFADVLEPAQQAGIMFSEQASLYNQYVYFWRWAFWKAFEQDPARPAIVSFITASSWINNPVFVGLRDLALSYGDEIWVTDLGGEGRGNNLDDNVFAIQTPVAIVTIYRRGVSTETAARVSYRRIEGSRAEKLAQLDSLPTPADDPGGWVEHAPTAAAGFIPPRGNGAWDRYPKLIDVFPWQQPGVKVNRTWPISPDRDALSRRWKELLVDPSASAREEKFAAGASGRDIHTQVAGLAKLDEVLPNAPHRPIVRYAFRSFDRQWIFNDPRLINLERPALWASHSDKQIFLTTMIRNPLGSGPAATLATAPPDLHHFRGSFGGKDVFPLYRDRAATSPNIAVGILAHLPRINGDEPTAEDLFAYAYALLAHPGYTSRFAAELVEPGPRLPMTSDATLFMSARDIGRKLIALHSFGERSLAGPLATVDRLPGVGWIRATTRLPVDDTIQHDPTSQQLQVADGVISGVSPEVWDYSVSGWPVLRRWIESRSKLGRGHARSRPTPLDRLRSDNWLDEWNDELLDLVLVLTHTLALQVVQEELLNLIVDGPLVDIEELPLPEAWQRAEPA